MDMTKRAKKNMKGMKAKERRIEAANNTDADARNFELEAAAQTGRKEFQDKAEWRNKRIQERDKLHGPGYKCGGKVKKYKDGGAVCKRGKGCEKKGTH